uniref:PX domain containing serine/threonine kinase like n=1 Tax=Hucho hucho TaxID=62062 RepID=A0A4W5PEV9_9TELE
MHLQFHRYQKTWEISAIFDPLNFLTHHYSRLIQDYSYNRGKGLSYVVVFPLQNPYIYPVTFANTSELSALVIRMFNEKGTLRDLICKVKPKEAFMRKYCNPKKIQGLELQQIRTYGRQILEVLKFLHDKGFPYGHLHASNIVIEDNTCKVLDIENSLLGLPSYYRPYIAQFRKINVSTGRREQPAGPALVLPALHRRSTTGRREQPAGPALVLPALHRANQQHRRLTRAQSHHGSEEEKRRRKILARKVENRPARYLQTHTLGIIKVNSGRLNSHLILF